MENGDSSSDKAIVNLRFPKYRDFGTRMRDTICLANRNLRKTGMKTPYRIGEAMDGGMSAAKKIRRGALWKD